MSVACDLTLRGIDLKRCEPWTYEVEGLCVLFPKAGAGHYTSADDVCHLVAGDVLVLNPSRKGRLSAGDGEGLLFQCFSVSIDQLYPLLACNELCLMKGVTEAFKRPKRYPASSNIARECHQLLSEVPSQVSFGHRTQLLRILAALLSVEFRTARPQTAGSARAEERLIRVVENLSIDEIMESTVKQLSRKFCFGQRHVNRIFREQFGFSLGALKMEMRLLKAASWLRDPQYKVLHVAEQCGFHHLGQFNTYFKRRFGASPAEWRNRCRLKEIEPAASLDGNPTCQMQANGLCPWSPTARG